jgi:hypothetical protein
MFTMTFWETADCSGNFYAVAALSVEECHRGTIYHCNQGVASWTSCSDDNCLQNCNTSDIDSTCQNNGAFFQMLACGVQSPTTTGTLSTGQIETTAHAPTGSVPHYSSSGRLFGEHIRGIVLVASTLVVIFENFVVL